MSADDISQKHSKSKACHQEPVRLKAEWAEFVPVNHMGTVLDQVLVGRVLDVHCGIVQCARVFSGLNIIIMKRECLYFVMINKEKK